MFSVYKDGAMTRCPRCNYENADVNVFCMKCGTFFDTFVEYKPSLDKYAEEMQADVRISTPSSTFRRVTVSKQVNRSWGERGTRPVWDTAKLRERRSSRRPSRSSRIALKTVRALFYFLVATPLAIYGLFTTITTIGDSTRIASLALFCAMGLALASIAFFYRYREHRPRFGWMQFLLSIVVATVGWMMAMLLEYVLIPDFSSQQPGMLIFGLIFTLYGCTLAYLALY